MLARESIQFGDHFIIFQLSLSAKEIQEFKQPSDEEKRQASIAVRQLSATEGDDKKWRVGEQDFEMLMKQLDNVVSNERNL